MYIAVLDKDCTPHYFINEINARRYLTDNTTESNWKLDVSKTQHAAELYNEEGISIGYYYTPKFEDVEDRPEISKEELKKKLLMEDKNVR